MKLDRNTNGNGSGKYGLIKNRRLEQIRAWDGGDGEVADQQAVEEAVALLERAGLIEWGYQGTAEEFFVIKLKDKYAGGALHNYASHAVHDGEIEYGQDIMELAKRSGEFNPHCKKPD